jgi:hypothetical protein
MKAFRNAMTAALVVFCVGISLGQDVPHDVDKGAAKTGQAVKGTGKKVGHATKSGARSAAHGTKAAGKDTVKGVKKLTGKSGKKVDDGTGN